MSCVLVWMIVYNEARYVRKTIQSIQQSSYKNIKILISDNHSTDGTLDEIERARSEFPNLIQLISPPTHVTSMAHWDFVWEYIGKYTTEPYMIFCGGHDLLDMNYIERLVNSMEQYKGAILVSGVGVAIDGAGAVKGVYPNHTPTLIGPNRVFNPLAFITKNQSSVAIHGLVCRRAFAEFRVRYHCPGADILLLSEMSIFGDFICRDDAVFFQRFSEGGASEYMAKHMNIAPEDVQEAELKVREQYEYIGELCERASEGMPKDFQDSLKVITCAAWLLKLQYAPLRSGAIGAGGMYLQLFLNSNSETWSRFNNLRFA